MRIGSSAMRIPAFLLAMTLPGLLLADVAHDWVMKIQESVSQTSYQGTFVYRQGDQMEVMRIAHRVGKDGIRERLISLNGWAREIIRNNDEVVCYLPDKKAVMAGHRASSSVEQKFPSLLTEKIDQLSKTYKLSVAKAERIAGRPTMLVAIKPSDNLRYGYRLWADRQTGLLLKSDLLDERGGTIEQFMFTNIQIGQKITDEELVPTYKDKSMVWNRASKTASGASMDSGWDIGDLPAGFRITEKMVRNVPGKPKPVAHLLVSDGLAAVSVFIEKSSKPSAGDKMVTNMGAAHAYRGSLDGYMVTAVGEVPALTVERIGRSISKQ